MIKKTLISCKHATLYVLVNKDRILSLSKKALLVYHLFVCEPCRTFSKHNEMIDQHAKELNQHWQKRDKPPEV